MSAGAGEAVRVERDGVSLHAEVSGPSGAPWLVLANSLGATAAMWDPQMPALEARRRVLRFDARGHGRSGTPPAPYAMGDFVGDALAVMDHVGAGRADVMGLSLGGMTGMALAVAAPERVSRLVVVAARADAPEPFVRGWDDRIARLSEGGVEALWEGSLARWLSEDARADEALVARLREGFTATTPEGYRGCAEALKGLDVLRDLGRVEAPTLYVAGAADQGAPVEAMRAMAEATPGARLEVIDGAAHIVNLDRPAAFERAVLPFLDA